MPVEATWLAAFMVGLLGGVHCAGMCGGIVGALTLGLEEGARGWRASLLPYLLAYNGARIASYTTAGSLMGGVGHAAANLTAVHHAQQWLQGAAGTFMVALGLYLGGWWNGVLVLERAGGLLWRRIEPLGRRYLPVRTVSGAFVLGLLWGWLPCGLVYSVLVWTVASGGVLEGALLMFSFGLGTLPTLLAMGVAAARLGAWMRKPWLRRTAGGLVVVFGVYTLWLAVRGGLLH